MKLSIAQDFSPYPAGRFLEDGPFNATKFRNDFLIPGLKRLNGDEVLEVTLDGIAGAASAFLEEAFGGLVRVGMSKEYLRKRLAVSAQDDTTLGDLARQAMAYIEQADESG